MSVTQNPRSRFTAAAAFALLLAAEILIGRFAGGWLRAYGGDVLVIPLLYCLIRIVYTRPCRRLPAAVGGLGALAELLQWLDLCGRLGVDKGSLAGILLGSSADPLDLLCYALGTALLYLAGWAESMIRTPSPRASSR